MARQPELIDRKLLIDQLDVLIDKNGRLVSKMLCLLRGTNEPLLKTCPKQCP